MACACFRAPSALANVCDEQPSLLPAHPHLSGDLRSATNTYTGAINWAFGL